MTDLERWCLEKIIENIKLSEEFHLESKKNTSAEFVAATGKFLSIKSTEIDLKAKDKINSAISGIYALLEQNAEDE